MTILRPSVVTDRYNDASLDWDTPTETPVSGWLHDLSSFESLGNRDTTQVSAQFFCPADTDLRSGDRIRDDQNGVVYEVDGVPNVARTPSVDHHLEASLRVFDDVRGAV
jgi:hypothetical protein